MNWVRIEKVGCAGLASVFIISGIISLDKPEINLPPNYNEPHEASSNHPLPQWQDNIVVASTATYGAVNYSRDNIL